MGGSRGRGRTAASHSSFLPGEPWAPGEPQAEGEGVPPVSPRPLLISDAPRRGGQSGRGWDGGTRGPQSLSDPTAEDPFRFRLVGFGFVSSSSWKRWGRRPLAGAATGPRCARPPAPAALTEALLEPDSSSALGGCVAFFRLRGLDRAAFLRLLGGLLDESSYSSAREKRSLNLRERAASAHCSGRSVPPARALPRLPSALLHLVGLVAAGLHVLQRLENRGLAKN